MFKSVLVNKLQKLQGQLILPPQTKSNQCAIKLCTEKWIK